MAPAAPRACRAWRRRCPCDRSRPRARTGRSPDRAHCRCDTVSSSDWSGCTIRRSGDRAIPGRRETCRCQAHPRAVRLGRRLPLRAPIARAGARSRARGRPAASGWSPCSASKRLSTALAPMTCHTGTGSPKPLTRTLPRSRYSKRSPRRLRVMPAMITVSGSAMRLKPRRKIGGLADDCLLLGSIFADQVAHDDRAGGDANADMKFDTDVGLNGRPRPRPAPAPRASPARHHPSCAWG